MISDDRIAKMLQECSYKTSRSSGPGGQNVNKVESRVELRFSIHESFVLSEEEKTILLTKLASRINQEGVLSVVSQESRSQIQNKEQTQQKFIHFIQKAFRKPKHRKPTKPTKSSKIKRANEKKNRSEIKNARKKII